MKSKVALVRCNSYNQPEVNQAVARGLDLLGGASAFVKPSENLLLKVNLLAGDVPEKCVTTHPAVFRAVAEQFLAVGATVRYGDSPGFGSSGAAAKKAGITDEAEALKLEAADFKDGREVFFEEGSQNKKFFIANAVLDCDGLISLPKMKTHGLERFTGAVKNQFGCVVGMRKGEFHVKLPDATDFAKMLVDLNSYVKPRLYIMDGIIAMEGNGPRGGTPRPMNVLLFSTDPIALDATCGIFGESELIGQILRGHPLSRLCAGVNLTLVKRVLPMLKRYHSQTLVITGGVALNGAMVSLVSASCGMAVVVPEHPQHNGAIGCATL